MCQCTSRPIGAIRVCTTRTRGMSATICWDDHMIGSRICACSADIAEHTMHASGGIPFASAYSISLESEKVIRRKRHKEIVVTVHRDFGAAGIVAVCVARRVVGGAYRRYIHPADSSLRRVAAELAVCQHLWMFSSMALMTVIMMPLAFPTRSRFDLNLEILVVAAMSASSSSDTVAVASARSSTVSESTGPPRQGPPCACPRRRLPARPCACPRRRRLDRLHAPLPAAAIGRRPSARGRPPRACACGRRSGLRLPACATTKSTWDRPWASWPSFSCGTRPAAPQSPRRCEGAREEQLVLRVQRHALAKDAI
jgi:hypothetical protein